MKKKNSLYIVMLSLWIALMGGVWYYLVKQMLALDGSNPYYALILVLLIFNDLFITYLWLNGVKDLVYLFFYFTHRKKMLKMYEKVKSTVVTETPKVLLLYCTCNDFDETPLFKCMQQKYSNFETVILDDSSKEEYKTRVDEFAKKHNVKVVRRENRVGFKAGNINNYLMGLKENGRNDYDYVVILDSDEVIPENFITESLKYFYTYDNIGLVQANHISNRNRNKFMDLFHVGVNSHWPTYQTTKHYFGFMSMLGHGAMISKKCYEECGGFPNLVAEDLCLSIEARSRGYYVAFAPNIMCEEEFPINYMAFKKRHMKWTQGNMEFIKKYTGKILKSKMHWFEKLDIFMFSYNLPLTALIAFSFIINLIILPILNYTYSLPIWMFVLSVVFFIAPMLNDVITYTFKMNFFKLLLYLLLVFAKYGSMLFVSMYCSLFALFGKKAVFIVTPKSNEKVSFWQAIKYNYKELIFATVLVLLAVFLSHSIWPVLLITIATVLSVPLSMISNIKVDPAKVDAADAKIFKKRWAAK